MPNFHCGNTWLVILPWSAEWLNLGWLFTLLVEFLQGLFPLPVEGIFEPLAKYFCAHITFSSVHSPKTLCKKKDNLRYVFIHKNQDTLLYAIFHESFEIYIYIYTKSMTLCVTWIFYIQKSIHFEKGKTICVTFFQIQKSWHFALRTFHGIFEIGGGGWAFLFTKKMHFALNFYMQKTTHFSLGLYTKIQTLCVTFLYLKKSALCVTFLYLKSIVYYILITNHKRTYDQRNQIGK